MSCRTDRSSPASCRSHPTKHSEPQSNSIPFFVSLSFCFFGGFVFGEALCLAFRFFVFLRVALCFCASSRAWLFATGLLSSRFFEWFRFPLRRLSSRPS